MIISYFCCHFIRCSPPYLFYFLPFLLSYRFKIFYWFLFLTLHLSVILLFASLCFYSSTFPSVIRRVFQTLLSNFSTFFSSVGSHIFFIHSCTFSQSSLFSSSNCVYFLCLSSTPSSGILFFYRNISLEYCPLYFRLLNFKIFLTLDLSFNGYKTLNLDLLLVSFRFPVVIFSLFLNCLS